MSDEVCILCGITNEFLVFAVFTASNQNNCKSDASDAIKGGKQKRGAKGDAVICIGDDEDTTPV